jgi:hypothetical protein
MRITIDIDDATGAVTITPGTNAPDTSAAEERRMAAIRSFVCAPAPSSPLSPDTDLPVADYSVMAFLAGVPWWDMAEPGEHDEAVAFAEWLESVGGPKRDRGGSEPALDSIVVEMSDCLVQVSQAQHALNMAVMKGLLPDRLSGRHVVFDVTGAVDASLVAINEIVAQLYKRDAASIEFIADNEKVAETIAAVLGWEDVATLLPVTLVDNSSEPEPKPEPEPEPEPDDTKPVRARSEDGTYVELPPDTLIHAIVCQHEQPPQHCRWCRDESMGVMLKTRFGKVFVPLTNPGDPAPTASWVSGAYVQQLLAEVFEKGKA